MFHIRTAPRMDIDFVFSCLIYFIFFFIVMIWCNGGGGIVAAVTHDSDPISVQTMEREC